MIECGFVGRGLCSDLSHPGVPGVFSVFQKKTKQSPFGRCEYCPPFFYSLLVVALPKRTPHPIPDSRRLDREGAGAKKVRKSQVFRYVSAIFAATFVPTGDHQISSDSGLSHHKSELDVWRLHVLRGTGMRCTCASGAQPLQGDSERGREESWMSSKITASLVGKDNCVRHYLFHFCSKG